VDSTFSFNNETNQIIAQNGAGKTNILEGICVSATGKTNRGVRDRELVRFGEEFYRLECDFVAGEREQQIVIIYDGNKKKISLNDVDLKKTSELIGKLAIVTFSPDDLFIIKQAPKFRRRLIDSVLCQIDSKYLFTLNRYNKALMQKRELLKKRVQKSEIIVWNESLLETGVEIAKRRLEYVKRLEKLANEKYNDMMGLPLKLEYKSDFLEDASAKLDNYIEKEIMMEKPLVGVQKDDLEILAGGREAKLYSSQGQIRAGVIALKLAEIAILEEEIGEKPVLLLDDVMSELDEERRAYIAGHIKGVQTVLTTTAGEAGENCIYL